MSDTRVDGPSVPAEHDSLVPTLVTTLREGYDLAALRADAISGLTVAIVALPLSMAIAIASGLGPERGLYTAIIGGFLISLLGGSRFQIGGPAGAFIVLVSAINLRYGYDGLALATMMAGAILVLVGVLRLGTYIRYIPYPVTIGFTAGIAVIIFASQVRDLLGLNLPGKEPAALIPKIQTLAAAISTISPAAVILSASVIVAVVVVRRIKPAFPILLVAVATAAVLAYLLHLPVETIGSRFGQVPAMLPAPHLPPFSIAKAMDLLPEALTLALLGGIESLLSAVVADGMSDTRHRSNCELVAQGIANVAAPLFGGFCVTGTIARTATNVRAGARGPVSGMLHAAYLLAMMALLAPLMAYIPLAALAGVLAVVAWNMAEKEEFWQLIRASIADGVVLLTTFLLTLFHDLTVGIGVGMVLGSLVFMHRMANAVAVEAHDHDFSPLAGGTHASTVGDFAQLARLDRDVMVYRLNGPLFFGASAKVSLVLDRLGKPPKAFILDFAAVPLVDSSGAQALENFVHKLERQGTHVYFSAAKHDVRRTLMTHGLRPPHVSYAASAPDAARAASRIDRPITADIVHG